MAIALKELIKPKFKLGLTKKTQESISNTETSNEGEFQSLQYKVITQDNP